MLSKPAEHCSAMPQVEEEVHTAELSVSRTPSRVQAACPRGHSRSGVYNRVEDDLNIESGTLACQLVRPVIASGVTCLRYAVPLDPVPVEVCLWPLAFESREVGDDELNVVLVSMGGR